MNGHRQQRARHNESKPIGAIYRQEATENIDRLRTWLDEWYREDYGKVWGFEVLWMIVAGRGRNLFVGYCVPLMEAMLVVDLDKLL